MCGVLPPRLLQDHSLTGDPHYIALVKHRNRSGAALVNRSDPSKRLNYKHHSHEKPRSWRGLVGDLQIDSTSSCSMNLVNSVSNRNDLPKPTRYCFQVLVGQCFGLSYTVLYPATSLSSLANFNSPSDASSLSHLESCFSINLWNIGGKSAKANNVK
jgi:hypothetical protein